MRVNGQSLLIDCGEGTQVGIRRLGWGFRCLDGLLLTHYHGDHCTGLAGLLLSLEKAGRDQPFHIWGPKGLKRVVEGLCVIVPPLSYTVLLHELPPEGGDAELIGLKIHAFPVDHGGIPCFGYRLVLERPEQVLGERRRGITLVFSTDTRPCETLEKNAQGADLLILEGMYGDEEKMPQALKNHHMIFPEAARIARKAEAGALLLTHFSTSLENPEQYLPEVRKIFEKTWAAKDGETVTMRYPEHEEKAWISLS